MRLPLITAVACLTALQASADPLPQGDFMLGTPIWAEDWMPIYATVFVDGTEIRIELSSVIAFNDLECSTTGQCVYVFDVATAQAEGDGPSLTISGINIAPTPPESIWDDRIPPAAFAERLLGLMNIASARETTDGFALTTAAGPVQFFRADADARDAIRAYAVALEISIRELAACEVRGLAPLLASDDASAAEAVFRQAIRGFAHLEDIRRQSNAANPFLGDAAQIDEERVRALAMRGLLPNMLALMYDGPLTDAAPDAAWESVAEGLWNGDRAVFDADIAGYDGNLLPLAAFLRHLSAIDTPIRAQTACPDLSFGFIAAQEDG